MAAPLVSSGLAYKAATGIATAGIGYLVTLQFQLAWGWSASRAAIGLLPQVIVLIGAGPFVDKFVRRVGFDVAALSSAAAVVLGLAVYATLARYGYGYVAASLVLVALGMRVNGVVTGTNVLRGLPEDRTSIGSAMVDTASEVASAAGIAIAGTALAAAVGPGITESDWSAGKAAQFSHAVVLGGWALTAASAALVLWGLLLTKNRQPSGAGGE